MGVAHPLGLGLQTNLNERIRMLRQLERIAAEVSAASPTALMAVRALLNDAEAELDH
jgi:hypothetical protein